MMVLGCEDLRTGRQEDDEEEEDEDEDEDEDEEDEDEDEEEGVWGHREICYL